jgi:ATP-binding cassette subfamily C (CFTR/MRP) protein 1
MAMQYAFQVIWGLAFFVMHITNVEAQAVSLERIRQYSTLPPEESDIRPLPPASWPQSGRIEWDKMGLRYRKGLPPALRDVSCTVRDGEKVGVCGRTGAGKSSMTVGLLRLADEIFGAVRIDGIDHASIPMSALRSKLALIPQEVSAP